jgi:hypothetical protein
MAGHRQEMGGGVHEPRLIHSSSERGGDACSWSAVLDGRTTGWAKCEASAISGGEMKSLSPGIVHIPAKMSHQVLVAPGSK